MKKTGFLIIGILSLFLLYSFGLKESQEPNCLLAKSGTFKHLEVDDSTAYLLIKGEKCIEYFNSKKYKIVSEIEWLEDCEFRLTLKKIDYPGYPFKQGDQIKYKITNITSGLISYQANIEQKKWEGTLLKIKD